MLCVQEGNSLVNLSERKEKAVHQTCVEYTDAKPSEPGVPLPLLAGLMHCCDSATLHPTLTAIPAGLRR